MAEFKDIAQGFNRMCDFYNTPPCEGCPMGIHSIDRSDCMSRLFAKPDKYEGRVLKWIEEHPAPVYPTFREWLISIGVIDQMSTHSVIADMLAMTPIPADTAQKLGIDPEEG